MLVNQSAPEAVVVETTTPEVKVDSDPFLCGYVSDSPASGLSLWHFMNEFYGSDSDVDSVLSFTDIPSFGKKITVVNFGNSPSAKSESPTSTTASNGIPLKKIA
ncbi:UNVERIFIED_CONTAM: hypothetical protein Sangu_0513500 [Sesamum angustifolium]|uniref:Uncharacterized protein n=1 Tax=Sesamum angustifolium TaxID=2727405 RepID=A0AAW2Q8Q7_9LAMI